MKKGKKGLVWFGKKGGKRFGLDKNGKRGKKFGFVWFVLEKSGRRGKKDLVWKKREKSGKKGFLIYGCL